MDIDEALLQQEHLQSLLAGEVFLDPIHKKDEKF
jgi:hypothetical protein